MLRALPFALLLLAGTVLAPRDMVQSWSAGATSFSQLSPLVPSAAFEYR